MKLLEKAILCGVGMVKHPRMSEDIERGEVFINEQGTLYYIRNGDDVVIRGIGSETKFIPLGGR